MPNLKLEAEYKNALFHAGRTIGKNIGFFSYEEFLELKKSHQNKEES